MVKRKLYYLIVCTLCFGGLNLWAQVGKEYDIPSSVDSSQLDFKTIQQNLIKETGKNSIAEAIEYFRVAKLFIKNKDFSSAEKNLDKSLAIYQLSKTKTTSKRFSISKSSKTQSYPYFDVETTLTDVYLKTNQLTKTEQSIKRLEKQYSNNWTFIDLKIRFLQHSSKWQELLNYTSQIESKSLTKNQKKTIFEKKTLAKTKLGKDEELFSNTEDMQEAELSSFEKNNSINKPVSQSNTINDKVINQLSYETQEEIANTYKLDDNLEKELTLRQEITKNKDLSSEKKAKQKLEIGNILQKKKEDQKAIESLLEGLKLAKEAKNPSLEKESLLKLINTYNSKKNYRQSNKFYKELLEVINRLDSIKAKEKTEELKKLNANIGRKEILKNIDKKRELNVKEAELYSKEESLIQEQLKWQKIIISLLVVGILALILLVYWYHKQRKKLQRVNLQLESKNMRNQMNPHFIFNSLNAVNHFISQKNELLANEYLTEFALLMRNTLHQFDMDLISLEQEIVFLKRYCELEKMRFENKFDFDFKVDSSIEKEDFKLPPLLLQPLVENAVWHGLRYLEDKGRLIVSFAQKENKLCITISDNGIGRERSKQLKTANQKKHKSKGVGIINKRIEISNQLTSVDIQWEIKDQIPSGTLVNLVVSKPKK